jgi:hypothetical protein
MSTQDNVTAQQDVVPRPPSVPCSWVATGNYDANDTAAFLAAWRASTESKNIALDIRILNSFKYRWACGTGAEGVLGQSRRLGAAW